MAKRWLEQSWLEEWRPTRREFLRGAVVLGVGGLAAACAEGEPEAEVSPTPSPTPAPGRNRGGTLRIGVSGGGPEDTIDPHLPTDQPDIARVFQLFEPLGIRDATNEFELLLAESIEPNATGDVWTVRLKEGIEFHNGKTVDADDVIFSIRRIIDPDDPKIGFTALSDVDGELLKKLDDRTVEIRLTTPFAEFPDSLGQYFQGIVPVDFDPTNPVGTGAFKFGSFTAGDRSTFVGHENYWRPDEPYLDEVVIIDFPDETARVNALLGGQVDAIVNLPLPQVGPIEADDQLSVLSAETGSWLPLTMRVDVAPFDKVGVRQALRLIAGRQQMVDQALAGQGLIGNDLYGRFDPCYASHLPQREQDFDQARSLLKQEGEEGLEVELVTSPVAVGIVEASQVFAEQAREAGVTVNIRKVDTGTFYGDKYLQWPFAVDFWFTRGYLAQTAQGSLPTSPFNETHWEDPEFISLIEQGRVTVDEAARCEILHRAQEIEHERGGYIIWGFNNQVDAHIAELDGVVPAVTGIPFGNYGLRSISFA